jgi:hypothetical protein
VRPLAVAFVESVIDSFAEAAIVQQGTSVEVVEGADPAIGIEVESPVATPASAPEAAVEDHAA